MRRAAPAFLLLGATLVWGWTFVVVRDAILQYPVVPFLALRFTVATLVLSPILLRRRQGWRAGLLPGVVLAGSYLAQTLGLRYTAASRAGLLTGLFVVFTPLVLFVLTRRAPARHTIAAVVLAVVGTALLSGLGGRPTAHELLGDSLEIATALLLSFHIVLLSRVPATADPFRVGLGQMSVMMVFFSLGAVAGGGAAIPPRMVTVAVLITGVLASAAAFSAQTYAQQHISPGRTALMLVAEPAFATLFGVVLGGDRFTAAQAAGAALILLALGGHEAVEARQSAGFAPDRSGGGSRRESAPL